MKRKELLDNFDRLGKDLTILGAYKDIEPINVEILLSLSQLHFLEFFRLKDEYVVASTAKHGKEIPTRPGHESASGVFVLIDNDYKTISFHEINSIQTGHGSSMVAAVMKTLPKNWQAAVIMDYSYGFWENMKRRYDQIILL